MAATADETRVVEGVKTQLFIGGEWRDARGGATLDVEDPATGETIATVADATHEDADAALAAATEAFATWRNVAPRERADILRRAYDLIDARADELALLMTLEMGKPVAESLGEITYANNFLRWYSEEAVRINGRFTINETGKGRVLTLRQPIGPCLFITPWNFPLAMGTRKIGPALATGCTCVVKPAKQTPLSMLALAQIFEEAGLPGGVLNVITASSSGTIMAPLIEDPRVRKMSFTGSTPVGKELIKQSAEQVLKVSMELGGNAPFLVFEDADLDAAVEGALLAKMRNGGEACTSANRFHVHESVGRGVRRQAGGEDRRAEGRARDRGRHPGRAADRRGAALQGRRAGRRRGRQGRARPDRRCARRRRGLLLRADGPGRRPGRRRPALRGDLRPGRADHDVRLRRGGDRPGQRHRVRPRRPTSSPPTSTAPSRSSRRWRPG